MSDEASLPSTALTIDPLSAIQQTQAQQALALTRMAEQLEALNARPLRITDFDMPFGSLVGFMVKAAIASIPAAIIIAVLYFGVVLFGGLLLMGLGVRR